MTTASFRSRERRARVADATRIINKNLPLTEIRPVNVNDRLIIPGRVNVSMIRASARKRKIDPRVSNGAFLNPHLTASRRGYRGRREEAAGGGLTPPTLPPFAVEVHFSSDESSESAISLLFLRREKKRKKTFPRCRSPPPPPLRRGRGGKGGRGKGGRVRTTSLSKF